MALSSYRMGIDLVDWSVGNVRLVKNFIVKIDKRELMSGNFDGSGGLF